MSRKPVCSFVIILLFCTSLAGQNIDPPKLTPTPSSESQNLRIKEGIALHDRGNYEGAIARYEEVLKQNPDNVWALYEAAYSYSSNKDYRKSLELAYKGAQYKSDSLPRFYLLIGNNLDLLGEPKKSIEVYKQALKLAPNEHLLFYNLAITYRGMNNPDEAKKALKKALFLNHNHPSSHLALATTFYQTGLKTPALLAVSRFLILEPTSERAGGAFKLFQQIISGGATPGKNPNEITISMDLITNKEEGDFGSVELVLGLSGALAMSDKNKGKTAGERLVGQLDTVLAVISETEAKGDKSKFTWKYYVPYFLELKKKNYVEPFAYYISQRSSLSEVRDWLDANSDRVNEFLSWSKSFQWPRE